MVNKDEDKHIIEVETENTNITVSETEPQANEPASALSNQRQLLNLAKTFAIEGGLLPVEKQMPIQDRAERRERTENLITQSNLETIITKALSYCSPDQMAEKADQDWFHSFTQLAGNISNDTMQGLWAKILAGEIAMPGSFSIKTLKVFRDMNIHDAKLFARLCSIGATSGKKQHYRIFSGCYQISSIWNIFDNEREVYLDLTSGGINYGDILDLTENHLMFGVETETKAFKKGEHVQFEIGGITTSFVAAKNDVILQYYKLSPIGVELANLVSTKPNETYLKHLEEKMSRHFTVTTHS